MKDISELIENRKRNSLVHFFQMLSNLAGQANGNLNTIVRRLMKEKEQYLCGNNLAGYLLIAQMRNKSRGRKTNSLGVSLEALLKLNKEALQQ